MILCTPHTAFDGTERHATVYHRSARKTDSPAAPERHSLSLGPMVAASCARVACGPTAHPRTSPSSSSRPGHSRGGVARVPTLIEQLQPAAGGGQGLWAAMAAVAPADTAAGQSVPATPLASSRLVPRQTQAPRRPQRVQQRSQQQCQQQQPRAPATAVLLPSSLALAVRQLDVHLNEPPQPLPPQAPPPQQNDEEKDFFANVGDAIRTLREDYPLLFVKDLNCELAAAGVQLVAVL